MIMQTSKSFAVLLLSSIAAALPQEQVNDPQVTLTTITVGLPTSCTFKPTQTITATTGCETPCSTYADNCWWDILNWPADARTAWGITTITPTTCPTLIPSGI
ncbi:hypothetical protein J7T55_002708 [Diaporthe amygdali]|uniref:uncharacterized protein n=1 Tax=Phomopsis amygdali TaxID=1214568 RepID=UPI0022FDE1C8|nr:uncharacterized protein J7T55_002708 [Diaporthe amygdali]KAJ0122196.1 hypothetical protein J7T55_002708 [Diaporthe amygdali]